MGHSREFAKAAASYGSGGLIGVRNRFINGDIRIDQRNNGSLISVNGDGKFPADRFVYYGNGGAGGAFSAQKQTAVVPPGYVSALKLVVTTARSSLSAGDYFTFGQMIEADNISDFDLGLSTAGYIVVSFMIRSSVVGAYHFTLRNGGFGSSYRVHPAKFTITQADTWQKVVLPIQLDITNSGLWNRYGTEKGLECFISLAHGSTWVAPASDAWQTGLYTAGPNQTNWMATVGNTMYVTGFQVERGREPTAFDFRHIGTELQLAQRYYCHSNGLGAAPDVSLINYNAAGLAIDFEDATLTSVTFPAMMRATPTMTVGKMCSYDGSKYKNVSTVSATPQGISYLTHDAGNYGAIYTLGRSYKFSWIANAEL